MMAASVILFLITTAMAKHHHRKDPNDNFFGTVYVGIHSVVDDLFESINLDSNFANSTHSKLLLTMHNDLSNIADKTFETFKDIQKIVSNSNNESDLDYLHKDAEEGAVTLNTIVKEILNKNNFDVYSAIKGNRHKHAKDKTNDYDVDKTQVKDKPREIKINAALDESIEFTEFVINFLRKVNNLSVHDFKKSSKHDRRHHAVPSLKNLKVWDEPSSLKYDLGTSYETRRIFKGSKATQKSFPFIVSIHVMGEFTCSGCIISRALVITAASCLNLAYKNEFFERNLKSIYVRLGSAHTTSDGETIPVENVYFHPGYDPKHLVNNLALIGLEKRIRFSRQQKRIRRILWDTFPGALSNDTKNIIVLGWGTVKADPATKTPPKLRVSKLDVYNTDACRLKYSKDLITNENFCAALNGVNGSACSSSIQRTQNIVRMDAFSRTGVGKGDAGGPAIVGAVLVGVVSFGAPECGVAGSPTVFTKLGYYAPWIDSIVKAHLKINVTNDDNVDTRRQNMRSKRFPVKKLAKDNNLRSRIDEYPKEIQALRNTLMELVQSDPAVVHDAIYDHDTYDEFSKYFNIQHQIKGKSSSEDDSIESLFEIEFKFEAGPSSELEEKTHTETPMFLTTGQSKPPIGYEDGTGNHVVHNDYTDNYEGSSKDVHELSFEVTDSFMNDSLSSKKCVSNESESREEERGEEIPKLYVKSQKHSKLKDSIKKYTGTSFYLASARRFGDDSQDDSSSKKSVMNNRLSKHASSILDEGKSLATKNFFNNAKARKDKNSRPESKKQRAKISRAKGRKDQSKSSHKITPKTF